MTPSLLSFPSSINVTTLSLAAALIWGISRPPYLFLSFFIKSLDTLLWHWQSTIDLQVLYHQWLKQYASIVQFVLWHDLRSVFLVACRAMIAKMRNKDFGNNLLITLLSFSAYSLSFSSVCNQRNCSYNYGGTLQF